MLKKIKHTLTGTDEKKRIATNVLSLGVLQGANYILPFLTIPYLVRVLGPEYFGLIAFSASTIMYFMLITDYGFNLSATRQISLNRHNTDKITEIFSAVMIIKIALTVISFVLMALMVFSFEKFSQHWQIYFTTFGMVIGQALFPAWLFQGMERMKYISYLNLFAKAFFTGFIFVFVNGKSDYLLPPLLTSLGMISAGICSLYFVKKEFNVSFKWQNSATLRFHLAEGWHVFFSTIAISIYTVSTTFILGLFASNAVVGYFSAADKLVQAAKGLYAPVAQAIYPLIGKKLNDERQAGLAFIERITTAVGISMFVVSGMLFLLAEQIVNFILGEQYHRAILLLKIMSFLPYIIALSNIYGIQTMLNLGHKKAFTYILVVAAILGLVLSLTLVPFYQDIGTAATLLLVEIFVTVSMFIYVRNKVRKFT